MRTLLAGLLIAAVAAAAPVRADDYPNRPIHLLVGFIPGSAADITARVLGSRLGPLLGQQVVVENRPGAGANLAAEAAARAPKDGYTLFLGSSGNVANQVMAAKPSFDVTRDFVPIGLATAVPTILVVHPSTGVKSVAELIALAKARPGEILYGSPGVGTSAHLSAELFNVRVGVKMIHVPYQGSPQAVTDLVAGRIAVMFAPAPTVVGQIDAGTLVALASAAATRPGVAPNLPTMAEAGMPDFETGIWFGVMAPAGTPQEIVDKLAKAVAEAMQADETRSALRNQGMEALGGGPERFAGFIVSEMAKWTEAARAAGLKK